MVSVLFVCLGNTCRSVIATALAQQRLGSLAMFESAGIAPQGAADAANAIRMLAADYAIDASAHVPRSIDRVNLDHYNYVIALDPEVRSYLRVAVPEGKLLFWDVEDPWGAPESYRVCAQRTEKHVGLLGKLLVQQ